MTGSDKFRIKIPFDRWTPVRNDVIDEELGILEEKRAGLVYLILYDRAWHRPSHAVSASMAELSRWMGMDARTVRKCIDELEQRRLIRRIRHGVKHSHANKPCWRVPGTQFDLPEQAWTPVPRFLITKYCAAFPNAVLLVVLLRYQHMSWQNKCWPGVRKLCTRTGWSPIRVRRALAMMGHESRWRKLGMNLPRPMEISYSPDRKTRHYRVLAVSYQRQKKSRIMLVAPDFRERFKIPE